MWDWPILVSLVMAFLLWRFILLVSPIARRKRAARDLAYADFVEKGKVIYSQSLVERRLQFKVGAEPPLRIEIEANDNYRGE